MPLVSPPSQLASLVARARAQEPAAWDVLLREHQHAVYAYVAELVRDRHLALDLVQEAFVDALKGIGSLRDDTRFTPWLFGLAHQRCLRHFRRDRRTRERFDREAALPEGNVDESLDLPGEVMVRAEDAEAFMHQLARLPEAQRSALLLHVLEDFSLEEIAEVTAVPVGTVKSRLHHAKRAMRQYLEEQP